MVSSQCAGGAANSMTNAPLVCLTRRLLAPSGRNKSHGLFGEAVAFLPSSANKQTRPSARGTWVSALQQGCLPSNVLCCNSHAVVLSLVLLGLLLF